MLKGVDQFTGNILKKSKLLYYPCFHMVQSIDMNKREKECVGKAI